MHDTPQALANPPRKRDATDFARGPSVSSIFSGSPTTNSPAPLPQLLVHRLREHLQQRLPTHRDRRFQRHTRRSHKPGLGVTYRQTRPLVTKINAKITHAECYGRYLSRSSTNPCNFFNSSAFALGMIRVASFVCTTIKSSPPSTAIV